MKSSKQPTPRSRTLWLLACMAAVGLAGCKAAPGKPGAEPEVPRPEQVLDFPTLYSQNCAACHGASGKNGAAIPLANPVYIAVAGVSNIQRVTAAGVPGTAMPPFSQAAGGMLTDRQIAVLAQGIVSTWGDAAALAGQTPPAYASSATGDPAQGQKTYSVFCAQCHGADASGAKTGSAETGSLVDPAYLALITDQGLRSIVIAGQTEQGKHDWRSYLANRPMTDHEVTDVVAWLASHRIAAPGQPYKQH
jgi:mono/diheme cytochrome c family protein